MAVFQVILIDIGADESVREHVRARMAEVFKLSSEEVTRITSKLPRIVASGLKKRSAERYLNAFQSMGATAEIRMAMDDEELKKAEAPAPESPEGLTHRQIVLVSLGENTDLHFKLRENLAAVLEISRPQMMRLTAKLPAVLKRHVVPAKAENLSAELKREGGQIEIRPDAPPPSGQIINLEPTEHTREYIDELINCGLSRKIMQQHLCVFKALEEFIGSSDITRISEDELKDFQSCFVKRLSEARDISLYKSILQGYYNFLERKRYIPRSPIPPPELVKKGFEFNPRSLEMSNDDWGNLDNAADTFQQLKPSILKSLAPFEPDTLKSGGHSLPVARLFQNLSMGVQSLVLTCISIAIVLLLLYGISAFGVLNSSGGFVWDKKQFVRDNSDITKDMRALKNWFNTLNYETAELEKVKSVYDLAQLVGGTSAGGALPALQNSYLFNKFDRTERMFIFRHRENQRNMIVLNMKLKEAYLFNEGVSKKLFTWQ